MYIRKKKKGELVGAMIELECIEGEEEEEGSFLLRLSPVWAGQNGIDGLTHVHVQRLATAFL